VEWFYRLKGQETGPVSANDLKVLFRAGTINAETQVRRKDKSGWRPLRHFVKAAPPSPPPNPAAESSAATTGEMEPREWEMPPPTPPHAPASSHCSECGRADATEELIRFDDARICARCKPLFIQKLREGVRARDGLVYAGFWVRFGAKFIDVLLIGVIGMAIGLAFGLMHGGYDGPGGPGAANFYLAFFNLLIPAVYNTYLVGHYGATLGKMACGLKVVPPDGGGIGYPQALGRHFAEVLSGLIFAMGYIMAAFDSEKRALHDRICNTRVVRHRAPRSMRRQS
jgi:uncharacterized RDD family membrane protein YckC